MAYDRYLTVLLSVTATLSFVRCDHHVTDCPNGYDHGQYLDHQYLLCWKVDWSSDTITFTAKVGTTGWIGLGFSPTGLMANSDVVIGWVKNDRGYLKDGFATGRSQPVIDTIQNVALLNSSETNGWTTLELKRNLTACESNDRDIEKGTTRVIFSYNPNDPVSEDSLEKHTVSGEASINFFSGTGNVQPAPLESNHKTIDLLNSVVKVPAKPTTYWCTPFLLPVLQNESHIIKIEPVIQNKHDELVRQILVLDCSDILKPHLSMSWDCEHPPDKQLGVYSKECGVVSVWATGGKGLSFPPNVGLPLSGATGAQYVLMQTHYNNPKMKSNYVDSSGIRLYYTLTKRQHDAAVLSVGHVVERYPYSVPFFLPPHRNDMALVNLCPGECTNLGLPSDGINVFASMLHTRSFGKRVRVKHIRNSTELPDIDRNDNYDFEFQDTVLLKNEVKVLPGDDIEVVCNYDTTDRSNVTLGGLGTMDEICLAYLLAYPQPTLSKCWSQIPNTELLHYLTRAEQSSRYTNHVNNSADIHTQYAQLSKGIEDLIFESESAYQLWNTSYWSGRKREYKCLSPERGSLLVEEAGLTKLPVVTGHPDTPVSTPEPCVGITPPSQLATPSPVSTTVPQTPVSVSAATQPPVSTGTQRASESMSPSAALFVVNSLWVVVGCATLDMMIR